MLRGILVKYSVTLKCVGKRNYQRNAKGGNLRPHTTVAKAFGQPHGENHGDPEHVNMDNEVATEYGRQQGTCLSKSAGLSSHHQRFKFQLITTLSLGNREEMLQSRIL